MRGQHRSPLTGVSVTNVTWRLVSDGGVSPGGGERGRHWSQHHVMSADLVTSPGHKAVPGAPSDVSSWCPRPPGSRETHLHCLIQPRAPNPAQNNRQVAVKNQSNSRQSDLGHQPEILSRDQLPNVKILKEKSIKQTRIGHFLSWLAH